MKWMEWCFVVVAELVEVEGEVTELVAPDETPIADVEVKEEVVYLTQNLWWSQKHRRRDCRSRSQ